MAKRNTVSLQIPPSLYSCVREVGRHLRASGHDVLREGEYAVSLLVLGYISEHRDDFDRKGDGEYVCTLEDSNPEPMPDGENNADDHPVIDPDAVTITTDGETDG